MKTFPDKLPELNEQDVREEIVAPIISALGYSSFGPNQIFRERALRYPLKCLGRKGKKGEIILRGKPDYELNAGPNHRIIIETKATKVKISEDDIDQTYSYASHQEVKAVIYIVTNGKKFLVFHTFNANPYQPIRSISYEELKFLPEALSFLIPENVQINFPLPKEKLDVPIISKSEIFRLSGTGQITYLDGANLADGKIIQTPFISRHSSDISKCSIGRDETGRIKIRINAMARIDYMKEFQQSLGQNEFIATAHDKYISTDYKLPTLFTGSYHIILRGGTEIPDIQTGEAIALKADIMVMNRFQANLVIHDHNAVFLFAIDSSTHSQTNLLNTGRHIGAGQISYKNNDA